MLQRFSCREQEVVMDYLALAILLIAVGAIGIVIVGPRRRGGYRPRDHRPRGDGTPPAPPKGPGGVAKPRGGR